MLKGSRLLREWRKKEGLSHAQAGKRLECSASGVWDWENDKVPRYEIVVRIEKKTDGFVPVDSWAINEPANTNASIPPEVA